MAQSYAGPVGDQVVFQLISIISPGGEVNSRVLLILVKYAWEANLDLVTKTRLFKYIETFTSKKNKKNSDKKTLIFFILLLKT